MSVNFRWKIIILKMKILVLLFVFALISRVVGSSPRWGVLNVFNVTMQSIVAVFLDNPNIQTNVFMATYVDTVNAVIYFVEVLNTSVVLSGGVTCTMVTTQDIAFGVMACSGKTTANSVSSYNCNSNYQQAVQQQELIESLFFTDPTSSACLSSGGSSDVCFGPLYVLAPGVDRPVPITNELMIKAYGVAVITGHGYGCGMPLVTYIDIERPELNVTANECLDSYGVSFTGTYAIYTRDDLDLLDVVAVFARQDSQVYHRFVIRRSYVNGGLYFFLETADGIGDYTPHFASDDSVPDDWNMHFPYIDLNMTGFTGAIENSTLKGCVLSLGILSMPVPLQLKPRITPSINNYFDELPFYYEKSRICGWVLCRKKLDGTLTVPSCATEGAARGGHALGMLDPVFNLRVRIPPNPLYRHYFEDCTSVYPWGSEFRTYDEANPTSGGAIQSVISGYTCRFPLYDTNAVQQAIDPQVEMAIQCYKMGGTLIESSHCFRQTDDLKCEAADGWIYFDEWCYMKFDHATQAEYMVKYSMETETCAKLGADVTPLTPGIDITAWLTAAFVYYQHGTPGYPYRMYAQNSLCFCFDWQIGGDGQPTYSEKPCNCNADAFPLCRYPLTSRPLADYSISMSPRTRALLRDGQEGLPWTGGEIVCSPCEIGSCGVACQRKCCPTYLDLSNPNFPNTTEGQSAWGQFFSLCVMADHGSCDDENPSACSCNENFGPPASLLPASPYYVFKDTPCQCYTGYQVSHTPYTTVRGFYIGDSESMTLYTFPLIPVCGGMDRGKCYTQPGAGIGVCECVYRIVSTSLTVLQYEPAYNGKTCMCSIAVKMATGYSDGSLVEEGFCNGAGVCCDSGESQQNQMVQGMDTSLFWKLMCYLNNTPVNGCVCYNGMTGYTCTCVARFDEAHGLVVYPYSGGYMSYVQFTQALPVTRVEVNVNSFYNSLDDYVGCTVTYVRISQSLQGAYISCTFVASNGWSTVDHYECSNPSNTEMVFVLVGTVESVGNCNIKAYTLDFEPCGYYTNPRAARFFANERYQGEDFLIFRDTVTVRYASTGCTATECMCDSNHMGPLCNYKVTAMIVETIDPYLSSPVPQRYICGENTEPPRGRYLPREYPQCDCLQQNDFKYTQDGCECVAVYSLDTGGYEMCAGNGVCVSSKFPYGICGYDKYDRDNDVLYTNPFSGVTILSQDWLNFTVNPTRTVSVYDNSQMDPRSVIVVGGSSWLFYGDTMIRFLPNSTLSIDGNISTAAPPVLFPFTVYLECDTQYAPVRGIANVTIWYLHNICGNFFLMFGWNSTEIEQKCFSTLVINEQCDPFDTHEQYPCTVNNFCTPGMIANGKLLGSDFKYEQYDNGISTCIASLNYYENPGAAKDIIVTGTYMDVLFPFSDLTPVGNIYSGSTFSFGFVVDCSDPVYRTINDAMVLFGDSSQCIDQPIGPYTSVLGEFYGIFNDVIPDLPFTDDAYWTDEHSYMVASLLDGVRCSVDVYDRLLQNMIIKQWISGYLDPTVPLVTNASLQNSTLDTKLVLDEITLRPFNYEYIGKFGSHVLASYGIYENNAPADSNWTFDVRPGYTAEIPTTLNEVISTIQITVPFDGLLGLQVIGGSTGQVCGTVMRKLLKGEVIEFNCFNLLEVNVNYTFYEIYTKAPVGSNLTEIADEFVNEKINYNLIYYYVENQYDVSDGYTEKYYGNEKNNSFFTYGSLKVTVRPPGYTAWFRKIHSMVLNEHRFPFTGVYGQNCTDSGYEVFQISVPGDNAFLQAFHRVHLAMRKCTINAYCATFQRGNLDSNCYFDNKAEWIPWLNGDPTKYPLAGGIGIEGGCLCDKSVNTGFFEPQTDCRDCLIGYGPCSLQEWMDALAFQENVRKVWTGMTDPFPSFSYAEFFPGYLDVNVSTYKRYAAGRFPWYTSSYRQTGICGGYGYVEKTEEFFVWDTLTFVDAYNVTRRRKCTTLFVNGNGYFVLSNTTTDLRMFYYYDPYNVTNYLNYIYGNIYMEGNPLELLYDVSTSVQVYFDPSNNETYTIQCNNQTSGLVGTMNLWGNNYWYAEDFFIDILIPELSYNSYQTSVEDGLMMSFPTTSPTVSPSSNPTSSLPTASPSRTPTTSVPTVSPTVSPSKNPSVSSPTSSPTTSPSRTPTTSLPTVSPSSVPSFTPTTSSPSGSPTLYPSFSPSSTPTTSFPTVSPSVSPTLSPSRSPEVLYYIVVGGGGGGGSGSVSSGSADTGGGGGGGGGIVASSQLLPLNNVNTNVTFAVTVGAGGAGGDTASNGDGQDGSNGGNSQLEMIVPASSSFVTVTSIGGGYGAGAYPNDGTFIGGSGGSGGGGVDQRGGYAVSGQGYAGGSGYSGYLIGGGGGGGGGPGQDAPSSTAGGNGGIGAGVSWTAAVYAGGGGGGLGGVQTSGGGGNAATSLSGTGQAGVNGYGGGGGGGGATGGNGGAGVVVLMIPPYLELTGSSGYASLTSPGSATYYNWVMTFTPSGGIVTLSYPTASTQSYTIKYLVVGGGGGGGGDTGGGGGGGGVLQGLYVVTKGTVYDITVGAGGGAGSSTSGGGTGGNSVAFGYTAYGGGGGGGAGNPGLSSTASGGGGSWSSAGGTGGSQGNNGGAGCTGSGSAGSGVPYNAGGGGGCSGVGGSGTTTSMANGGPGCSCEITGSVVYYGGGGGPGPDNYRTSDNGGAGGIGGGGAGSLASTGPGFNGTPNTGGGGGGNNQSGNENGGAGGSGVVIVAVPNVLFSTISFSGTVSVSSDSKFVYLSFLSGTGSFTA